ncbi:flavin reductase family protein [Kitasatospora sp. A2-31]|uniref:flavin reductase family protein n=1 Tax=Kitasatospora sp. A2-31 TaxID=2916414 RepID=UPI001EEBAFF8|nr:flavin reductase family protein [Kitasatospora sp. A2-31]MCG6494205.1 flavin reductase family protein [Kitasatospora sp. A2-31]
MSNAAESENPGGFQSFVEALDYPVHIVTTAVDGERAGCLVGFAGQCSIDPARFVVWISKANHTHRIASRARFVAVHLVPPGQGLAELFGSATGDEVDKFAAAAWVPGPGGVPVLSGVPAWFVGQVLDRADWGDHTGFLLDPITARNDPAHARALTYRDVRGLEPGHPA